MTTIKVKMRLSSRKAEKGTLYYQVMRRRSMKLIHSGYSLRTVEWDAAREAVVVTAEIHKERRDYLHRVEKSLTEGLFRLKSIVIRLERLSPDIYTAEDVVKAFRSTMAVHGFIAFGRQQIALLQYLDKRQKVERYTSALNSFSQFRNGEDLLIEDLDCDVMLAYEQFLKSKKLCINSISFYMRNLRAIYNDAVARGIVKENDPFKRVYTGIDKTVKRAISLETLRQIKQLDLKPFPLLDFARDLFMFSVYTRGMSFVDMAYLHKKDLHDGVLIYHRQKTGQLLKIKWEGVMQQIVDKYDTGDNPYLLPIIRTQGDDSRRQYKSALRQMNKKLKEIGEKIGLDKPLTSYVARHAWASIAKEQHVPISVISEAMGHASEWTTQIYLSSLDTSEIDNANKNIMDALGG